MASPSRTYGYDTRGNRVTSTRDGVDNYLTYAADAGAGTDILLQEWQHGFMDSPVGPSRVSYDYGWNDDDAVLRSVTVGGATWEYYYDALSRRRLKQSPLGASEEFFYDTGHQLLVDTSVELSGASVVSHQQDDYLWLAGHPIAVVRGRFDASWQRQADDGTCARFTVDGTPACGLYGIVVDSIGKPVLTLRADGKATGTGLYDDFGFVNRTRFAASAPMDAGVFTGLVGTVSWDYDDVDADTQYEAKVLFHTVDLSAGTVDVNGGTPLTGVTEGRVWSDLEATSTQVDVTATSAVGEVACEAVELHRHEAGTDYWFPPLRFPGQYHDVETDFFENWNRYYSALGGRYFQGASGFRVGQNGGCRGEATRRSPFKSPCRGGRRTDSHRISRCCVVRHDVDRTPVRRVSHAITHTIPGRATSSPSRFCSIQTSHSAKSWAVIRRRRMHTRATTRFSTSTQTGCRERALEGAAIRMLRVKSSNLRLSHNRHLLRRRNLLGLNCRCFADLVSFVRSQPRSLSASNPSRHRLVQFAVTPGPGIFGVAIS